MAQCTLMYIYKPVDTLLLPQLSCWQAPKSDYGQTNPNQPPGQQQVLEGEKHHRWLCRSLQIMEIGWGACLGLIRLGLELLRVCKSAAIPGAELVKLYWVWKARVQMSMHAGADSNNRYVGLHWTTTLVLRADYAYLSSTYVDKDQYEGQYLPGAVG